MLSCVKKEEYVDIHVCITCRCELCQWSICVFLSLLLNTSTNYKKLVKTISGRRERVAGRRDTYFSMAMTLDSDFHMMNTHHLLNELSWSLESDNMSSSETPHDFSHHMIKDWHKPKLDDLSHCGVRINPPGGCSPPFLSSHSRTTSSISGHLWSPLHLQPPFYIRRKSPRIFNFIALLHRSQPRFSPRQLNFTCCCLHLNTPHCWRPFHLPRLDSNILHSKTFLEVFPRQNFSFLQTPSCFVYASIITKFCLVICSILTVGETYALQSTQKGPSERFWIEFVNQKPPEMLRPILF